MGGIINIVIGIVCIVGGLSGRLALIGTDSGAPLTVAGALLIVVGAYRLYRAKKSSGSTAEKPAQNVEDVEERSSEQKD